MLRCTANCENNGDTHIFICPASSILLDANDDTSEGLNPELGVQVWEDGDVSNVWEDGTVGVPIYIAEQCQHIADHQPSDLYCANCYSDAQWVND